MQSMPNLNQAQQQEVIRFQQMQQSLEIIMQQKGSFEAQLNETELAVKELEQTAEDGNVYQMIGNIMIKKNRNDLLESSKDRLENLKLRVNSLAEQEKRIKMQYEEQKKKIQNMFNKTE